MFRILTSSLLSIYSKKSTFRSTADTANFHPYIIAIFTQISLKNRHKKATAELRTLFFANIDIPEIGPGKNDDGKKKAPGKGVEKIFEKGVDKIG